MNRKTLQKVIEELKKDKPDLSYVRGILETIVDSLPEDYKLIPTMNNFPGPTLQDVAIPTDNEIKIRAEAAKKLTKYE